MRQRLLGALSAMAGILAVALACEAVLRLLPVSTATDTGYRIDPLILTYPPRHRFTSATGWDLRNAQTIRTNNLGFVSDIDFVADSRAVALIGDSYIESSMLRADQRPGAQLQRLLGPSRPVYAMGSPGTSLLDYAERIRYASQQLAVRDFVVFVDGGDVQQSRCGSGNVNGPCIDPVTLKLATEKRAPPSAAKRLLRQSALAQYVASQLRVTPADLRAMLLALPGGLLPGHRAPAAAATRSEAVVQPEVIDLIVKHFLDRVRPYVGGRLILVLNSPKPGEKVGAPHEENLRLAVIAARQGAVIVDMTRAFAAHAASSPLSLYVGPYDHHLNGLAMGLVARAAAVALGEGRGESTTAGP